MLERAQFRCLFLTRTFFYFNVSFGYGRCLVEQIPTKHLLFSPELRNFYQSCAVLLDHRLRPYSSWLDTQSEEEMAAPREISPASTAPATISASLLTLPLP